MLGFKANSQIQPWAAGVLPQSSVYGSAIPMTYGIGKVAPILIWANALRKNPAQGKKSGKGGQDYVESIDFLIGHNPIANVLNFWLNGQIQYAFRYLVYNQTGVSTSSPATISFADPFFNTIVGVSVYLPYDVTFNDYGAPNGAATYTGTYEQPLWNANFQGPDPTWPSALRRSPFVYRWLPGSGPTIYLDWLNQVGNAGFNWPGTVTVNIYYCANADAVGAGNESPLQHLLMRFENELGNGPEYAAATLFTGGPDQQIIYPWFAGVGGSEVDVGAGGSGGSGSGGSLPLYNFEVMGAFPYEINDGDGPQAGDADFIDMIEDIFKSGPTQTAIGGSGALGVIQHGLCCNNYPGTVQAKTYSSIFGNGGSGLKISYDLPNTEGNFLIAFCHISSTADLEISDAAGNIWTKVFATGSTPVSQQVWYAQVAANTAANNTVTIAPLNAGVWNVDAGIFEVAGLDSIDQILSASGTGPSSTSISTTNLAQNYEYLLNLVLVPSGSLDTATNTKAPFHWNRLVGLGTVNAWLDQRQFRFPITLSVSNDITHSATTWTQVIFAFKNANPPPYPFPLGDILDDQAGGTLDNARAQCQANGLWGSLVMDNQQKASNWVDQIGKAADVAFVWSGFKLKVVPWSEVSAVGHGATYVAPTASGPIANFAIADFIGDSSTPPVTVTRKAQVDSWPLQQIQHPNRANFYDSVVTSQPNTATVAIYGIRKDSPVVLDCVVRQEVAQQLLNILVNRLTQLRNTYKFKLNAKWSLLEPMDLVTIPPNAIIPVPVAMNLLQWSQDFTNAVWTLTTGVAVTPDSAIAPDGTMTADTITYNGSGTSGSFRIYQTLGLQTQDQAYTYSIYLWAGSPTTVRLYGNGGAFLPCALAAQWQRFAVTIIGNSASDLQLLIYSNTSDNSPFTIKAWGAQLEIADNQAVVNRNLLQSPQDFEEPIWTKALGATVTPDTTIAPDGTQTADTIAFGPFSGGNSQIYQAYPGGSGVQGQTFTASIWIQAAAPLTVALRIDSNTVSGAPQILSVTTSWQRFSVTRTMGAGEVNTYLTFLNQGASAQTVFAWGAQLEFGLIETTYQNTIAIPSLYQMTGASATSLINELPPIPVRLTSVQEDEEFNLDCEAEQFIYGVNDPQGGASASTLPSQRVTPTNPNQQSTVVPAAVNTPIFIQPIARLTGNSTVPQLWIAVSDSDPNYGGCYIYLSTDGGNSYGATPIAALAGSAITGVTTADWPAAADPDTTNNLLLNLSESLGVLDSYLVADEDAFTYPCWIAGGTAAIPYELMTYAVATLTGTNQYTLMATGSGNHLRRAVFGAPTAGEGVDHPLGSRWCFLGPISPGIQTSGILQIDIDPTWIGKALYFKFVQFSQTGAGVALIADVTAYSYTPTGTVGTSGSQNNLEYSLNPADPLSQTTATNIAMAKTTVTFPSNTTIYNARNFTIADPGAGNSQIYYVTIYDPSYIGDNPGATNLTALIGTTQASVNYQQPGYVYMGSIVATHTGGGTVTGGGAPPPASGSFTQIKVTSSAPGNFTVAHGLGHVPIVVDIAMTSAGLIWLQSPTSFDGTNLYLTASDTGLTATIFLL